MKGIRKFDGKSYTYIGTYWDPAVVRLCLRTGRAAGYLMRQAKGSDGSPLLPGTPRDIFARKTSRVTGPLAVPVVVGGSSWKGEIVDRTTIPGLAIIWTGVTI